ncbi:TIGR02281 family clan AA aspartic protease [Halomicronema sp. CCY15110]|uniref:retropepsin-like aspartic protease family protein n=1 Tax=Halomicronema sp. CCY15110 TaxID=2767773 RepID=UPI001EF33EF7|nr:retropepsin-like aspartic protease [Halomicronema sp. CCY15110]
MNRSGHWLIGIGCCWMVSGCSLLPFSITITPSNTEAPPQETAETPSVDATTDTNPATDVETVADAPSTAAGTDATTPKARPNYFREAVTRAESAVAIGQSAQSPDDWQLAASRWQQAVQYMQQVPTDDPNHATAQQKVKEYGQNLTLAEQQAAGKAPTQAQPTTSDRPSGLVASIPIVETMGGTPVVPVKLQGNRSTQEFTMLFDTGASGTLITQEMASAIGVVVTGEALVTVADGRQVQIPVGYVSSITVGELVVQNVWVAIGGDVGLLGQDVYGEYGISIGGSQINLYE